MFRVYLVCNVHKYLKNKESFSSSQITVESITWKHNLCSEFSDFLLWEAVKVALIKIHFARNSADTNNSWVFAGICEKHGKTAKIGEKIQKKSENHTFLSDRFH